MIPSRRRTDFAVKRGDLHERSVLLSAAQLAVKGSLRLLHSLGEPVESAHASAHLLRLHILEVCLYPPDITCGIAHTANLVSKEMVRGSSYTNRAGLKREAAFGAKETEGTRFYNSDGTIGHVEVRIGDSVVMLFDSKPDWPATPSFLRVFVEDGDAVYQRALPPRSLL